MQISEIGINAAGVAAACCSMASFLPQAFKLIKERDASSVSVRMYIVTVIAFSLWTFYGALLKSWPLIGSNAISLLLSGWILGLKIWLPATDKGNTNDGRGPLAVIAPMEARSSAVLSEGPG